MPTRIALKVQYLGTNIHGFQYQAQARSVQEELERAILSMTGHFSRIHGAGRTDAGVHAAGQVVHFDTESPIPDYRWPRPLNTRLPADIMVRAAAAVAPDWHSRFDAIWREYCYTIHNSTTPDLFLRDRVWFYHHPLDAGLMAEALETLLGKQELETFRRAGSKRLDSKLEVLMVGCERQGDLIRIRVRASGFLYGMMRLLVGTLVQEVGRGTCTVSEFEQRWRSRSRATTQFAAPPVGLCLTNVGYAVDPFGIE
ncbi:MAG: tRNA pseudouridine(38-40) synthase TruA [Gloeobacterales cyanobacterium]